MTITKVSAFLKFRPRDFVVGVTYHTYHIETHKLFYWLNISFCIPLVKLLVVVAIEKPLPTLTTNFEEIINDDGL